MDILKVENLTKIYGKGENSFKALDNVSFSVKRGQFVAIVGPSGSGKSTLLHLIGGVDRPDGGHVYVDSNDVYARNDTQLAIFRRREFCGKLFRWGVILCGWRASCWCMHRTIQGLTRGCSLCFRQGGLFAADVSGSE